MRIIWPYKWYLWLIIRYPRIAHVTLLILDFTVCFSIKKDILLRKLITYFLYLNLSINIVIRLKCTAQKINFFISDFFSLCDQVLSFLQIWSHLLKKSLMKSFIFCGVKQHPFFVDNLLTSLSVFLVFSTSQYELNQK